MATKGNSTAQLNSPIDLNHIEETLKGMYSGDPSPDPESQDLATLLAHRERDLILAAEVGKALLEKNLELSQQQERITEEYNERLELLEQEKYVLRRRLETAEAEYESRVIELQTDVFSIRGQLSDQQHNAKSVDKDKEVLVAELTEQNQRLTQQLKQASKTEEQLGQQLQSLREQFQLRRVALHEHIQQLEGLREEIHLLTEKKVDLERRISSLTEERDSLTENLDETQMKAIMLERQTKDTEHQLRLKERELEDVRKENVHLRTRIDEIQSDHFAFGMNHNNNNNNLNETHTSLFNELEMADDLNFNDVNSPLCGSQRMASGAVQSAFSFHSDLEEDDNIECDDDFEPSMEENDSHVQDMNFYARIHNGEDEQTFQIKQEILKVYKQLRVMVKPGDCEYETLGGDEDTSQALLAATDVKPQLLRLVLTELKRLMEDIVTKELEMAKRLKEAEEAKMTADHRTNATKAHLDSVKEQLNYCRKRLEDMTLQLELRDTELKKKGDEFTDLSTKLTLQRAELGNIINERNSLKGDREAMHCSNEQAVSKAFKERDDAVEKKNLVEMELTKAQIELMSLDSQLMETIQQKIRLSQELERWQVDMATLIETQVNSQLEKERAKRTASAANKSPSNSLRKSPSWFSSLLTAAKPPSPTASAKSFSLSRSASNNNFASDEPVKFSNQ